MSQDRVQAGRSAEGTAADHLISRGYTMVTRRFKTRHGEIDLVCLDGEVLVFVEVKLRRAPGYRPEESVGRDKARALVRAADEYCRRMEVRRETRFDLICIDRDGFRHHKDFLGSD